MIQVYQFLSLENEIEFYRLSKNVSLSNNPVIDKMLHKHPAVLLSDTDRAFARKANPVEDSLKRENHLLALRMSPIENQTGSGNCSIEQINRRICNKFIYCDYIDWFTRSDPVLEKYRATATCVKKGHYYECKMCLLKSYHVCYHILIIQFVFTVCFTQKDIIGFPLTCENNSNVIGILVQIDLEKKLMHYLALDSSLKWIVDLANLTDPISKLDAQIFWAFFIVLVNIVPFVLWCCSSILSILHS